MRYAFIFLIALACPAWGQEGKTLSYDINNEKFEGYFVSPQQAAPLILLVHDWDGLNDYEMRRADMLAELGYGVFAADLFGSGVRPTEIQDKRQHTGELYKDRKRMRSLLYGALKAAEEQGGDIHNCVAVGYCFGGAAVLELARSGAELKGFVTFHGGLETPPDQDYRKTKGKILVFHGSADTVVTLEQFAKLAEELEREGIAHEMTSYGGAPHAFSVFDSPNYRQDADIKSWRRLTQFLEETFP